MPTLWQGAHVVLGDLSLDPTELGAKMLAKGWAGVWAKIHHGSVATDPGLGEWLEKFRAASGGKVLAIGWGVNGADPKSEAALIEGFCRQHHLVAYVADVEAAQKEDETPGGRKLTAVLWSELRRRMPTRSMGFTTYGAASDDWLLGSVLDKGARWSGPMDFASPWRAGARFIPQAYPNEYGEIYSLPHCVRHARRAGWPISWVHPMLGCYDGPFSRDPRVYVSDMIRLGLLGFSVFRGELMTDDDWAVLSAAIGPKGVARRLY